MGLRPLEPVDVRPLFAGLHEELVTLLQALTSEAWKRPTLAGSWAVRDVVAHLLDGDLRRLSLQRDGHTRPTPEGPLATEADLVTFLNGLNAEWVRAAWRLSPRLLVDLLKMTGPAIAELFASLEPEGPAFFPVAWAGEASSRNWFDLGREYTERWHHQQQIRLAVGAPPLNEEKWLRPVIDLSVRALPHRYREMAASEGARVLVEIRGASGGTWSLLREGSAWHLFLGTTETPEVARVTLDEDTAWRVFFKALPEGGPPPAIVFEGRPDLGRAFLAARAVMA
jgi:uncharacterized protein (TIGR03083 family)